MVFQIVMNPPQIFQSIYWKIPVCMWPCAAPAHAVRDRCVAVICLWPQRAPRLADHGTSFSPRGVLFYRLLVLSNLQCFLFLSTTSHRRVFSSFSTT